jgi:CheY-like chemotaxis protein
VRIAIVEDHVLIAKQLVALVTLSGHQAVAASNGSFSSIGTLIASDPELAFVDVSLYGRNDGLAISERLIQDHDIPTVFVTANRRRLPASFCDAVGVIDKPFNKLSFEKALSYIVARLTHAVTIPPLPASMILSPLYRGLWNEEQARPALRREIRPST